MAWLEFQQDGQVSALVWPSSVTLARYSCLTMTFRHERRMHVALKAQKLNDCQAVDDKASVVT